MTVNAMGQQKAQDDIQSPNVDGPTPAAFTVAMPVTIQDIRPDMIRPKTACAKRAGITGGFLDFGRLVVGDF